MLEARHRRGRSASLALGLFVFLLGCKRAPPPPAPTPPAAALVNGAPILVARLQLELDRVRRGEDGGPGVTIEPGEIPRVARSLLDALVGRAIVLQRAKTAGMQVSEAEVQRAVDALAEAAGKGSATFAERLAKDSLTPEQLADEMRERLLAGRYVADQTGKERASPAEARAFFDTHHADFDEPEMVHCLQLVVRTPDEAKNALDQLRRGASFDELAR